ncbi:SDR family NAD(P)-dependent oxidoreductase [Acrocarpospora catenulata]|uniref:SDR family NAD(P)-dependent oxidoreductase n=1 Tax=Acrocarpospora catenulata TaxID=2836182 RepID=UPI001BD941CA|nr:glucose 1-dehydrogenase [Acrocarpospora catenulata]
MFDDLTGKVAIVTGAGRGIGLAYATALAESGMKVVLSDILDEEGEKAAAELRGKGHDAIYIHADVSDQESVQALARQTAEAFDGIDTLVNNAGIWGDLEFASVFDISAERWDRSFAVNVKGVFQMSVAVAPYMKGRPGAAIINQASTAPYIATPRTADYSAGKAAVITLTKTLAKSFGDLGIRVNAIAPGGIATEASLNKSVNLFADEQIAQQCVKRPGQPSDLIGPLLFLASQASGYMSGQTLVVDGGKTMTA